tara:strand:- start:7637 stop:8494 length:858 start_codon:yes stop_codon:yes gene_type:complete
MDSQKINVAILGSGVMATGILQVMSCAEVVSQVAIIARNSSSSKKCIERCYAQLQRLVDKGRLSNEALNSAKEKIKEASLVDVGSYDFVIEAVSEEFKVKESILSAINPHLTDKTIVASNTSSISITALGGLLTKPENIVGLHFFNPAPLMKLVEVVPGYQTSDTTLEKSKQLVESIQKEPVTVNDSPGFIVNRMVIPMINEAVCILASGNASREAIDSAMKLGAHHPMGPLELSDLIGNDVTLSIMDTLFSETQDSKYRAHPLLRKMVRAGYVGRKVSKGFYYY